MPTRTEVKFKIKEAFIKNLPLNKNVSIHDFDISKLTEDILVAIEAGAKTTYDYFPNEQGDYTVRYVENEQEEYIAIAETAEKADFIAKACNAFILPD